MRIVDTINIEEPLDKWHKRKLKVKIAGIRQKHTSVFQFYLFASTIFFTSNSKQDLDANMHAFVINYTTFSKFLSFMQ